MGLRKKRYSFNKESEVDRKFIDKRRIEKGKAREEKRELVRVEIRKGFHVYCEPAKIEAVKKKYLGLLAAIVEPGKKIGGKIQLKPYGLPKRKR
jgi:hypothetical protein